ncbi:MAG: DUF177 domain-containing protein [Thermoanaerobaculia bacterium]
MMIRLDRIRHEPLSWQETLHFAPQDLELRQSVEIGPVAVVGRLEPVDSSYLLRARLRYAQTVACDRCLAPVRVEVEAPLDLVVVRRGGVELAGERELASEELGLLEVAGEELDTEPLIREAVQLGLPDRPLCREDCAGLCPRCGKDRNAGACDCADESVDPRWAALAALKNRFGGPRDRSKA